MTAASLDQSIKLAVDIGKEILINDIKEININDDRKLFVAAIKLYNDLPSLLS